MAELYWYEATLEGVVDGDTLDLRVDVGFFTDRRLRVRLIGVDTPEVYGVKKESEEYKAGQKASQFVRDWFATNGGTFFIRTYKEKTGKYGRWLAEVYANVGGEPGPCLNDVLVETGHAEAY